MELLSRLAWRHSGDSVESDHADANRVALDITRLLLTVLRFHYPLSAYDATAYTAMVGTVVDLVTSFSPTAHNTAAELATLICKAILACAEHLHGLRMPVIQLFQCLERLVAAIPEAAWRSDVLVWCAYFLTTDAVAPIERRLLLKVLRHAVAYGKHFYSEATGVKSRGVYVEVLVLPLASMLSTEGPEASRLLQDITSILAVQIPFEEGNLMLMHKQGERASDGNNGDIVTHATSFLMLIDREAGVLRWLDSLSFDHEATEPAPTLKQQHIAAAAEKAVNECWAVLLLASLLFDERDGLRDAAARALDRQSSQHHNKFWSAASTKLLVSGIVFLLSQKSFGSGGHADWRVTCLYVLASLAASANDTMKIVLRLVDSMKAVVALRATALKLLFAVWKRESRVYPRLEAMLLEDEPEDNVDYHIVRMATLKALCVRDPEAGVDFIAQIQACLEDPLVSVAGMALNAIAALCRGDCLDFYAAFKIIALKTRKKKISCASDPHFQEKLCVFYALGATSEMEDNAKQASKLLSQLWEFAETSEYASVRCAALTSLNAFPLDAIDLLVPTEPVVKADDGDEDEEDESDEEEVEENTALLLHMLATEKDDATREQVQSLVTRVLEHESRRHTAGIGRGQMKNFSSLDPSQQLQSVSAAATKELRKRLPMREEAIKLLHPSEDGVGSSFDSLVGFLLAYRPPVDDAGSLEAQRKSGKRKDRLVRLAAQNVESCENAMRSVLSRMGAVLPWSLEDSARASDCNVLLSVLALLEGLQAFMATYVMCLEEFANLKVPASAEEGAACAFFVDLVKAQMEQLLHGTDGADVAGMVAAGALIGQLCEASSPRSGRRRYWSEASVRAYFVEALTAQCRALLQAFEERKVFRSTKQRSSLVAAMLSVQLALANVLPARRTALATEKNASDHEWVSSLTQLLAAPMEKVLRPLSSDKAVPAILRAVAVLGISCVGCVLSKSDTSEPVKPAAQLLLATALSSLAIDTPVPAIDAIFAVPIDGKASERAVDQVVRAINHSEPSERTDDNLDALSWASLIGLAQLAPHFGALKALHWLRNVQSVLMELWDKAAPSSPTGIVGFALGPVLLESIRFGLSSSSKLDAFLSVCEDRMKAAATSLSASQQLGAASAFIVVPYMLSRMTVYAGSASIQERFSTFLDCTRSALASSRESAASDIVHDLVLVGIANCFSHSLGVMVVDSNDASSSSTSRYNSGGSEVDDELSLEMPFDTDAVARITQSLRDEMQGSERALAVFGAIARQSSAFHVSQKKKVLDVEMRALPANGLLFRSLELLRQASLPSSSESTGASSARERQQQVNALLACLATAGLTLPLFDYAPLVTRLMARMCCAKTSALCVRLASTQGSCDSLLIHEFATSTTFPVTPTALRVEILAGFPRVAARIPPAVLVDALDAVSNTVFESHEAGEDATGSSTSRDLESLVDSWIGVLSALGSSPSSISDETRELVGEKVLGDYLCRLPLEPADHRLAREFASRVLAPLDCRDRVADVLLQSKKPLKSSGDARRHERWTWWRDGTLFTELIRSTGGGTGAGRLTRRELALLVQWLLRHDFQEWAVHADDDSRRALDRLMAVIAELMAANTKHQDESAVSSLLDAVDGYARSLADCRGGNDTAALTKASALFELVARVCCLSWRECLSFEEFLLATPTDSNADANWVTPALRLMPTALLRCGGASKRWLPLYEQLWAVTKQQQPSPASADAHSELGAHAATLELCFIRVCGADLVELPVALKTDVDRWWSCVSSS